MADPVTRNPALLQREDTGLILIDVQEAFRPVIDGFDATVANCGLLAEGFGALGRPVLVSEQYPKGLGHTVAELAERLPEGTVPIEKLRFSACGVEAFDRALAESGCTHLGGRRHRDARLRQPDRARPDRARATAPTWPPTRSRRAPPPTASWRWSRCPRRARSSQAPRWPSSRCSRSPDRPSSRRSPGWCDDAGLGRPRGRPRPRGPRRGRAAARRSGRWSSPPG